MMALTLILVFFMGYFFINEWVAKFFLFRPTLLFVVGIFMVAAGIFLSVYFTDTQTIIFDKINNNKNIDPIKLNVIKMYMGGLTVQVKVYDYVLIPFGVGFIVSAIFMRFTLLLKEMDLKHAENSKDIMKMSNQLSNEYRDINYYLDNKVRGRKIISKHYSIKYLSIDLFSSQDRFRKEFGAYDFKYYKDVE